MLKKNRVKESAYMKMLCVFPNLTVLHIVSFRILETPFKVLPDVFERSIVLLLKVDLNFIERNGSLD